MVSVQKITDKILLLDEFLDTLKNLGGVPLELFNGDKILVGSAKYYLQVSIECCLDIANHVIAAERFRPPKDYADTFKVLQEEGIIDSGHGASLKQMAKFRNRLVHLYGDIDNAAVHSFINHNLQDIVLFKTVILKRYVLPPDQNP